MVGSVIWYGNNEGMYRGWWDMTLFEEYFKNLNHFEGFDQFNKSDIDRSGAIVVIPGRSLVGKEDKVNTDISSLMYCLLIVAGDEEASFDISKIKHPNIKIWVQNPHRGKHDQYDLIGCGYTPGTREMIITDKNMDWFFAGQITHVRRQEMADKLRGLRGGKLIETPGFTQGLDHKDYLKQMADAKIAPCPSGPITPDSFRLFEALELGCIPIADEATPNEELKGYWDWLFGEKVPFPTITNYNELPLMISELSRQYPVTSNNVQAWWKRKKIDIKEKMFSQFVGVGGDLEQELVTAIVPISPIPSHPNIDIVTETIQSIRFHFPGIKIVLTFDGVRPEQEKMAFTYNEHIRRVLAKHRDNIYPIIFQEHTHQVGMAREALKHITTPLILYMEQDTPLVLDEDIDWKLIQNTIISGESNVVRFHFEAHIPEEHGHLMVAGGSMPFQRTIQWSQRPHLANTEFYRTMLDTKFTPNAKCFIEDKVHGLVQDDYHLEGINGWNKWKLHIYVPNDRNIKRSYNLDGRGKQKKYDNTQIW